MSRSERWLRFFTERELGFSALCFNFLQLVGWRTQAQRLTEREENSVPCALCVPSSLAAAPCRNEIKRQRARRAFFSCLFLVHVSVRVRDFECAINKILTFPSFPFPLSPSYYRWLGFLYSVHSLLRLAVSIHSTTSLVLYYSCF